MKHAMVGGTRIQVRIEPWFFKKEGSSIYERRHRDWLKGIFERNEKHRRLTLQYRFRNEF